MNDRLTKFKETLQRCLARKDGAIKALPELPHNMIEGLSRDLESKESIDAINRDPYWPKWDSPWWKMVLLHEMGLTQRIPKNTAVHLMKMMNSRFIHFFPTVQEELPDNCDPYRDIICHCALGIMSGLLYRMGFDVSKELQWFNGWFSKYQLPDGGFNCDDEAYRKTNKKSSFLSTLPPLESILYYKPEQNPEDMEMLEKGAQYLILRRLCRSVSNQMSVIKTVWFKPVFPRFYDYDVLRGLTFLTRWALLAKSPLPLDAIEEAVTMTEFQLDEDGTLAPCRNTLQREGTLQMQEDGMWKFAESSQVFPLLMHISDTRKPSPFLTAEWYENIENLWELSRQDLLTVS